MSKSDDKIKELEKELETYTKKDDKRIVFLKKKKRITDLKKQIRTKKYGGIVQAGKNVGTISKNIYKVSKVVGKGLMKGAEKFIGEDPNKKGKKKKVKTVEEVMRDMPQ